MEKNMKQMLTGIVLVLFTSSALAGDLMSERTGFKTVLMKKEKIEEVLPEPPAEVFKIVRYKTEIGEMSAYLSRHQNEPNQKRPAIVWLTGGFPTSSPGDYLWLDTDANNEQSARIYRHYGIVMMFPTLRGRVKGNPGIVEQFYGEVNDVIGAGNYLKSLDYIDPEQVYLGGHSTGGTLALLVAEATDVFAAVICLGPSSGDYGKERANYEWKEKEIRLRSPKHFLSHIRKQTFIIEGQLGNADSLAELQALQKATPNSNVTIASVTGADHFNVIHPVNAIFAKAIAEAKGAPLNIDVKNLIEPAYRVYARKTQETNDLRILADLRSKGRLIEGKQKIQSVLYARKKKHLTSAVAEANQRGISATAIIEAKDEHGKPYYATTLSKDIPIASLKSLFALSKAFKEIAETNQLHYDYWTIAGK